MGISVLNVLLDTKNWKEYFTNRLKEIVVDNDYLKTLDAEELEIIQTKLLKAQFKNHDIDKEGSFLNFFQLHLHHFISEPFREDVSTEVLMMDSEKGENFFNVSDKVRYVCRSSGGKIQEDIGWKPDEGEFEEIKSLKITIQYPASHEISGKRITLYEEVGEDLNKALAGGVRKPIEKEHAVDGLIVITESEYVVEKGKFQYWQMAHPTRNFDITITYPENKTIQFKTLVLEDNVSHITQSKGYLKFNYGTWSLPQSGMAWLIK